MAVELFATLGQLVASLGNVQSAQVLRERVALVTQQLELVQQRLEDLEAENTRLVRRCAELQQQLFREQPGPEFHEARGALFKRLPGGGYSETPYCPACRSAMWAFEAMFPFECGDPACGRKAGFKGRDLPAVLAGLPK